MDRSWKFINCSQTHECGNWNWVRAIPYLGAHKWGFRYRVDICAVSGCDGQDHCCIRPGRIWRPGRVQSDAQTTTGYISSTSPVCYLPLLTDHFYIHFKQFPVNSPLMYAGSKPSEQSHTSLKCLSHEHRQKAFIHLRNSKSLTYCILHIVILILYVGLYSWP